MTDSERAALEKEFDDVDQAWGLYVNLYEQRILSDEERVEWNELGERRYKLGARLEAG